VQDPGLVGAVLIVRVGRQGAGYEDGLNGLFGVVVDAPRQLAEDRLVVDHARTAAFGLTVPSPLGGFLILDALYATEGTAVAVTDADLLASQRQAARLEGTWVCPEGAACFAAVGRLREAGWLAEGDRVVVVNTGCGLKYPETMPASAPLLGNGDPVPPRAAPDVSS